MSTRTRGRSDGAVDEDALTVAEAAYTAAMETVADAPRTDQFLHLLQFDVEQVLNAVHYGLTVTTTPVTATETGMRRYAEHNMAQFSYADVDLLYSPAAAVCDLPTLRQVVWDAQRLARIANSVATWERELTQGDPTSEVFAQAVRKGVVDAADLCDPSVSPETLADRIREAGVEEEFLEAWGRLYDNLCDRSYDTDSVDLRAYVTGMEDLLKLHLDSRGRI